MGALRDLKRGWHLRADNVPVTWSEHAIERYLQRVKPALEADAVRKELSRLLATAVVSRTPPGWVRPGTGDVTPAAYLLLADGEICLPVIVAHGDDGPWTATTALTASIAEGAQRERRNRRAQARRAGKASARKARTYEGGRPRQGPSASEWDQ